MISSINCLFSQQLSGIWPKHNEVISDRTPLLSWNGIEGITSYQISLSQDSTFIIGVQVFNSSSTQFQLTNNLISGTWFWKVNGIINGQTFFTNLGKFQVFDPSDYSTLKLWLRSDSVQVANGKVVQWYDRSGNNNNGIQNAISLQPSLIINGLGDLNTVRFLNSKITTGPFSTTNRSEFIITKRNGNPSSGYHNLFLHDNSPFYQFYTETDNFFKSYIGSSLINTSTTFDNSKFQLLTRLCSANLVNLRKNSIQSFSTSVTTPPVNNLPLSIGNFSSNYFNGDFAEILIFDAQLSNQEISIVENYLMDRYAPPVNLGADIQSNNGFCNLSLQPTAQIYTSYLWNTNATTPTISINAPGTYWIQTVDIFGRTSRDTIKVYRPVYDSISLNNQLFCAGQPSSISAFVPSGNYNFVQWSDGVTGSTRTITTNQSLSYTVSDNNGCLLTSDTANFSIDESLTNITLGTDTNLCSSNTIQLQNTPANITQYDWNTGNTQASQIIDTSGLYMLEVTNSNNCSNRDTIQVNVIGTSPTLNYSFPSSICQFSEGQYIDNSEVPNGNGTINNKTWSISEGSSYSGSSGTFAIDTAGTFNVTLLVETEQGCSSSATFPLTVHPKPILSFTTQNYCPYEEVQFTSNNSQLSSLSSHLWQFGDNTTSNSSNPTHVFGVSGIYNTTLEAQDINGCRDTVTQAVYIQPAPVALFSFNNTCEETEVNFVNNSNIADTFNITTNTWTYGDGTQAINPSFQKIFADADTFDVQLIVTANNGCQDTSMQSIIIYPRPTLGWQVGPACKNTWTTFENLSSVSVGNIAQTDWLVNLQYPLEGASSAYQFVTNGVQYLNLTSTTDNGCQRDTLIIVNVQPEINAAYTVSPETIVAGVPTVFTSTSTGATQYTWNLGNDNIIQTTVAEPVEVPGFDASLIGDSIQTSLIIENTIGCRDTATQYIKVYEPRIDLAITQLFVQDINGFYKVGVELRNQGFVEITKTDLLLKMFGSMPMLETENESLVPGESRIYLFNASPSAFISTQDNETSYLCVEATSYNDYQLIETELSNNIACINTEGENFVLLPIYPNPTNDDISYTFILSEEATIKTSLTDETGRIVMEQSELHSAGLHTQILSMRNLSAGVYYFHISDGTSAKTVKILKN